MSTVLNLIERVRHLGKHHPKRGLKTVLKLTEECGEVAAAYLGKGDETVTSECADVIRWAILVALKNGATPKELDAAIEKKLRKAENKRL